MATKNTYKKTYVDLVMPIALSRKKISNVLIAKMLGVTEGTVRNWRRDHPDFNRVFTDAHEMLKAELNAVMRGNLKTRRRKITTKSPDGLKVTTEEVLPTHKDVELFSKMGMREGSLHGEYGDQRDILRRTVARKISGELSALEAAQILEAEGIEAPKTLLLEVQKMLGVGDKSPPEELTPAERRARIKELASRGNPKPAVPPE